LLACGEEPPPPKTPPLSAEERFCDSAAGERLELTGELAFDAAEARDRRTFRRETDRALELAQDAPVGADCAVDLLTYLADISASLDDKARSERVKRFQREHRLRIRDLAGIRDRP